MDQKTKELVEYVEGIENGTIEFDSTDYVLSLLPKLCSAVREQDKRTRHAEEERDLFSKRIAELDESNASLSRHLGGLSEMLAACGLPSEPKALAGAIERERTANRERIVELEKEVAHLRTIALGA